MRQIDERLQYKSLGSSVSELVARLAVSDLDDDPDAAPAGERPATAAA